MSKYEDGPFFLDADGFVWRDNQDGSISMARTNPANTNTPEPFAYLVPARERCYICRPDTPGVDQEGCADCDERAGLHQQIARFRHALETICSQQEVARTSQHAYAHARAALDGKEPE